MKLLYIMSVFLLLFSCTHKDVVPNDPLAHFSKDNTCRISPSLSFDLSPYDIFKPEIAIKLPDGYIVKNQTNENLVSYVDVVKNEVIHGINRGDGPEELVSPSSFQKKGDDLFIYDIAKKNSYKLNVSFNDSLISLSEYQSIKMEERPFIISLLDNGGIASGIFEKKWIVHFDDSGHILSYLNFPSFEETRNLTDMELSSLYLSTMITVSPDGKKIACATQKHGVLSFADFNNQQIKEYKLLKYYAPKVSGSLGPGNPNIAFSRDSKIGFCGVCCNEKYVYALYSGRAFNTHGALSHHCEHVLVYNWEGTPIKHLIVEKPLYTMNYDARTNVLYGIGYDPEGVILEYNLNNII